MSLRFPASALRARDLRILATLVLVVHAAFALALLVLDSDTVVWLALIEAIAWTASICLAFTSWLGLLDILKTARIDENSFWVRTERRPEEWVLLASFGNGAARIIMPSPGPSIDVNERSEAVKWLEKQHFIPTDEALASGLVASAPQPPLKLRKYHGPMR